MPGVRWAGDHRRRQAQQSEDFRREMAALRAHWSPGASPGPVPSGSGSRPAGASSGTGAGSSVEHEWELHQETLRAWEGAQLQARADRERAFQTATRRWEAWQAGGGGASGGAADEGVRLPDLPGRPVDPAGLYGALGLAPGEEPDEGELKRAFRAAAKAKHPDRTLAYTGGRVPEPTLSERAAAEEEMRLVIEAYRVLSNPERRRQYNLTGRVSAA